MPGLLDYVKGYEHGGSVDVDPYADTSQAQILEQLGINVHGATGLLPTYDPAGANIVREAYDLRGKSFDLQKGALALRGRGLDASLDTARRSSTGSLFDLTKQIQEKRVGSSFKSSGADERAMTNVRSDIVSGFGDVSSDITRQRAGIDVELSGIGIDESQSYLDLQEDIFGIEQGYERDLLAGIGDLPEDSWSFAETYYAGDTGNEGWANQQAYEQWVAAGSNPDNATAYGFGGTGDPSISPAGAGGGTIPDDKSSYASDIRLKKDINYLFTMNNGIPIYTFKYKWSDDVNIGTMAQDIEDMIPEAVSINSNGYKMVDYSKVFNYG